VKPRHVAWLLLLAVCALNFCPRGEDGEITELRAQLAVMGDTAAVRDSTTRLWQARISAEDSAHAQEDSASARRIRSLTQDAAAADARFEDLLENLPDQIRVPLELAHEDAMNALRETVIEVEGERDRALERIVTRDSTIASLVLEKEGWQAERIVHERLAAELTERLKGNISLFGLRLRSSCGATAAAGIDATGKPNAVVGVGCTIGR
jgi:hypothetical protein